MFTVLKYAAAWFPMMLIAIINGAFREMFLTAPLGALRAHQLSTLMLLLLLSVYIAAVIRVRRPESAAQAWLTGFIWLAMTLAFEFGFGHVVQGKPWVELLKDYDLSAGRLWAIVPVWMSVAPRLFYLLLERP